MDLVLDTKFAMIPPSRDRSAVSGSPTRTRKPSTPATQSIPTLNPPQTASCEPSPFTTRYSRRYHSEPTIPYPLPCDVPELARQNLIHELQKEVYGGLHCCELPKDNPPKRICDIGCGTGLWCVDMARELAKQGITDVEFYGVDIVPTTVEMPGVNFTFVHWNILTPLPFEDDYFDFIFARNATWGLPVEYMFNKCEEFTRILKKGGTFEIQCYDPKVRSLMRSNVPYLGKNSAYNVVPTTTFSSNVENTYLDQWNSWIDSMMTSLKLTASPTQHVGPMLLMLDVNQVQTRRIALPFDDIWWEAASDSASDVSVGTKNYHDTPSNSSGGFGGRRSSQSTGASGSSKLTEQERTVRELGRLCFTQMVDALEGPMCEATGLEAEEWERWYRDLCWNLLEHRGARNGECWEFGAWWGKATKA